MTSIAVNAVAIYTDSKGNEPLTLWIDSLDKVTRQRVKKRLARLKKGNFGDWKKIDKGLYELRLHFGSGYRIYFAMKENYIVLLLNGGDKAQQGRDIQLAKYYGQDLDGGYYEI